MKRSETKVVLATRASAITHAQSTGHRLDRFGSNNFGKLFEERSAYRLTAHLDGRPECNDLERGGKVIECKFFTVNPLKWWIDENGKKHYANAEQNSANGFKVGKNADIAAAVKNYCEKFDFLVVGYGPNPLNPIEEYKMNREEAYKFLMARVQAKGAEYIRFCPYAETKKAGGRESRLNTLKKYGHYNVEG